MMSSTLPLRWISGLALALLTARPASCERPNIVFFLVDDLGWMDTATFGSPYYETPNIDRLARSAVLFTDAYSANPLCSPTRASILTGKYPARIGITAAMGAYPPLPRGAPRYPATARPRVPWLQPESLRYLPLEEVTYAELLRDAGYRTAHVGKWHLGISPEHRPRHQGFDAVFDAAPDDSPPSYFSPYGFEQGSISDGPEGEYLTDRLTDEAIRFIESHHDTPFLLNLWHFGVHGPWQAKAEDVERFDAGKESMNPVMAAMIHSIDESVGQVLDALERLDLKSQTVVIFFSDNGGHMGQRVGPGEQLPTSNSPLRGAKSTLFEGGIRVPLIISWPGHFEASRTSVPVSSIDLFPTLLELAGLARPSAATGTIDGTSLIPLLTGSDELDRERLFNFFPHGGLEQPPGVTVRQDSWKLIRWFFASPPWFPERHELYDLENDLGETTNLASVHPEQVELLDAAIDRFLADTKAPLPKPNPDFSSQASLLGGWSSAAGPVLDDGALRLALSRTAEGSWHDLRVRLFTHAAVRRRAGRQSLTLRARVASATEGRVVYGVAGPREATEMNRELEQRPFSLTPGGWQETTFELPAAPTPTELRLEFRAAGSDVEIDWIRLSSIEGDTAWPSFTTRLEWRFDPVVAESSGPERRTSEPSERPLQGSGMDSSDPSPVER